MDKQYFGKLWRELENIQRKFLENGRNTHLQVNATVLYFVMVLEHGRMSSVFYAFESSSTIFTNDLQDDELKNIWMHMEKKGQNGRK